MKTLAQSLIMVTTALALLSAGLLLLAPLAKDRASVIIESEESKNPKLESVFNEVRWIPGKDRDIWMMNQSHYGRELPRDQWERLAIVIDKTKTPPRAHFYQLKPGPLEWSEDLTRQQTAYRASCFLCHNNGPRAIRPLDRSTLAALTWKERLKITWWNLQMKSYGRIRYDLAHDEDDLHREVPFRFRGSAEDRELKVAVCMNCHKEDGLFARGALHFQQRGTIEHMVTSGAMPPLGFHLSKEESLQLQDFLHGF